jgi:DNA polymerase (family 10)
MSLNAQLSEMFRTAAAILDIRGEPVFKAIAFSKVSRILDALTSDVKTLVEQNRLAEVEGIGASSRKIIEDVVRTGVSEDFESLRKTVPPGLIELLEIPSLGPKTIALLWRERNITSIDELSKAIEAGALAGIKGLGEKKIAGIQQGIAMRAASSGRVGIADAWPIAAGLLEAVRAMPQVEQAEIAGSLRRGRETVGDVDLIAALKPNHAGDGDRVTAAFAKLPVVQHVLGAGETKASVMTTAGLQVDLRIVPRRHFGAALLYFTGSKDHNVRLRSMAQDRGLTLNEWGLYKDAEWDAAPRKPGEPPALEPLASKTEADVYAFFELDFIEPELREDRGEVALAAKHALPRLITRADIRGDLHTHTHASDGTASIEQMAEAARALGYEFLAITDHSRSSAIANGLSVERLMKHVEAIRRASDRIKGITLLAGSEVDILADGHLDYEDEVLAELDWVVASPHTALKQDAEKATTRILRALENRHVNVIGHPTGRLIGAREGLPLDFAKVYRAAADANVALEINAGWPRLDLDDVRARGAIEAGVMLCIDTDAHGTDGLDGIGLGITVARRAGVEAGHVLNCRSLASLQKWIKSKRG